MKKYPVQKVISFNYFFVIFFLFFSLFFIDAAIGGIKVEKQFSRSSINNNLKNTREVSTIKETESVSVIIENRFVATGVIVDIKQTAEKPQRFVMLIKDIEPIEDYANFGEGYLGKSVEILSEIGIPCSFRSGLDVSLVLRVSGDERGQYLFLVKVLNDDKT